jgi:hypothetical protein
MKCTIVLALVVLLSTQAMSQNDTGIFVTIKCSKNMPKQTAYIQSSLVCLAPSPLIEMTDFESVTEILLEGQKVLYFDLGLSRSASERIHQLSTKLPSSTFALKIKESLFSTFPATDVTKSATFRANGTIRFKGKVDDLPMFLQVQEDLEKLIKDKKGAQ